MEAQPPPGYNATFDETHLGRQLTRPGKKGSSRAMREECYGASLQCPIAFVLDGRAPRLQWQPDFGDESELVQL